MSETKYSKIIVHAGDAHRDDFISVAIALATVAVGAVVERRDPSEEELEDPEVLVLDVGGRWESKKGNYDHHQQPRGDVVCALSMFAADLLLPFRGVFINLWDALQLSKWAATTEWMDSQGPFATAKHLGTTPEVVFYLLSPVESSLLDWFSKIRAPLVDSDMLHMLLQRIGADIVEYHLSRFYRIEYELSKIVSITEEPGVTTMIIESDDITGLDEFRERHCPGVVVSISHDNRGPGWTLYRYEDDPRVDFSRVSDLPGVEFAHKGGFVVKTADRKSVPITAAIELVRSAIVPS